MNTKKSNTSIIGVIMAVVIVLVLIGSCGDNSSDYDSNYSYEYTTDSDYRDNVNDIADIFGEDPADVDRIINDVADSMNE